MAYQYANRVKESTTTTGTGTITLSGTSPGYITFASGLSVGDTTTYCIDDTITGDWEIGIGTLLTATTLGRTSFISSSTGTAVSFAAGIKNVFITQSHVHFLSNAPETTVPAGTLQAYNLPSAGRQMLAQKGPSGVSATIQPHLALNKIAVWLPIGNAATHTAIGAATLTATGTATTATIATTNSYTCQIPYYYYTLMEHNGYLI